MEATCTELKNRNNKNNKKKKKKKKPALAERRTLSVPKLCAVASAK